MIINKTPTKQRGDTIVEVLLSMAVVGLVLGAAFGIANRSLNVGRSAHERTTALKLAETQLELLKVLKVADLPPIGTDEFCINETDLQTVLVGDPSEPTSPCADADSIGGAGFLISITPPLDADEAYKITVTWDRIGDSSGLKDDLSLYYKLGAL